MIGKRTLQHQLPGLVDAQLMTEVLKAVSHRQGGGGKHPATTGTHHLAVEAIGDGKWRQIQRKVQPGGVEPVGGARLLGPAEALEFALILHQPLKAVIEPLTAPERQLQHVIAQAQRVLQPQQGAVEQGVAYPVPQIASRRLNAKRQPLLAASQLQRLRGPGQLRHIRRLGALRQGNLLRDIDQLAAGEALAKIAAGDVR